MTRLIDLSQTIEADMVTYPGLPGPVLTEHLSRADSRDNYETGTEFLIGRIDMVSNTGTYLDFAGGSVEPWRSVPQQATVSSVRSAQLKSLPEVIALNVPAGGSRR